MHDNNITNSTETISISSSFALVEQKQADPQATGTVTNLTSIPSRYLYPTLDDISPIWSFLLCLSGLRYSPTCHKVIQWVRGCAYSNNTITNVEEHSIPMETSIDSKSSEIMQIRRITKSRVCCLSYYTLYSYGIHAMFIGLVMGLHAINKDYQQVIAGVPGMIAWILLRIIFHVQEQTPTPTFEHPHSDPAPQPYYRTRSALLYTRIRYIIYLFHALILAVALALIVFFGIVAQRWSITILIWVSKRNAFVHVDMMLACGVRMRYGAAACTYHLRSSPPPFLPLLSCRLSCGQNIYTITLVGVGYIYFLIIIVILHQQTDTLLYYFQEITKDQHYIHHNFTTYQACYDYVDRIGKIWSLPVAAACLLFIWAFIFGVREYLVKGSYGGLPWLLLAPFMFVCLVGPILWLNLSSSESSLSRAALSLMLSHSLYTNADVAHGCHMFLQSMAASPIQLTICGITPTAGLVATSVAGPIVALLWSSGQAFVTNE